MLNGFYDFYDYAEQAGEPDFSFLQEEPSFDGINANDFLHGYCDVFAYALQKRIGGRVEAIIVDGFFIHAYVVVEREVDGVITPVFCDVRGETSDCAEFLREFEYDLALDFPVFDAAYPLDSTRTLSKRELRKTIDEYVYEDDSEGNRTNDLVEAANAIIDFYSFWGNERYAKDGSAA